MSVETKTPSFGRKGVSDHARTLAESLLSGKPLARTPQKDRTPKLKARPKAKFGRRLDVDGFAHHRDGVKYHLDWRLWVILVWVAMLGV